MLCLTDFHPLALEKYNKSGTKEIYARHQIFGRLVDNEINYRVVQKEVVADPIPVVAPSPSSPAQSKPEPTGIGEDEQGYMEPFISLSSLEQREEPEAQAEAHTQHPQEVRNSKI